MYINLNLYFISHIHSKLSKNEGFVILLYLPNLLLKIIGL